MATILTKKSDTASAVPLAADLTNATGGAELAVNATDKRLFSKTSGGTVVELGTNPSSLTLPNGTANGLAFLNASKVVTSNSIIGFDGTNIKVATSGITANSYLSGLALTFDRNADNTISAAGGASSNLVLGADNVLKFNAAGSEGMRLTSTGLGIGTSSVTAKLVVAGGGLLGTNSTNPIAFTGSSGDNAGIGSYNANTDMNIYAAGTGKIKFRGGATWSSAGVLTAIGPDLAVLDSSGNLGLGVTPSAWGSAVKALQFDYGAFSASSSVGTEVDGNCYYNGTNWIYRLNARAFRYNQADAGHAWYNAASGTAGNAITFTQAMTLSSGGNLLIGSTTDSGSKLQVGGSSGQVATPTAIEMDGTYRQNPPAFDKLKFYLYKSGTESYGFGLGASGDIQYWAGASSTGIHAWYTSQTERARIDSSGNLLVGTTSATGTPTVGFCLLKDFSAGSASGLAIGHQSGTGGGAVYAQFAYNGSAIGSITQSGTTAVLYNTTSDQRLKENIQNADSASAIIDALQVRKFDWKSDNSHQRYGFIAQELATVAPEAVYQPEDASEMMAVDYSKLVPMLVKEIQSLRKRLADAGL